MMDTRFTTISLASALLIACMPVALDRHSNEPAVAEPPQRQEAKPIAGLSRQPSEAARQALLDTSNTVLLLLDHQTGLFQTVKDVPLRELRANTVALAKIAELGKIPIITTASEPNGTNGPLMSELTTVAPSAKYVARKGEVSAWDNADFVKAVEATGRKTLVIAGCGPVSASLFLRYKPRRTATTCTTSRMPPVTTARWPSIPLWRA